MKKMKEKATLSTVRIIGGQWRSRRLLVPQQGVRPTPDAVKETLFNWLTPALPGARCLDLFSGTGALGFEALSRGAESVDMVDGSWDVVDLLRQQAIALNTQAANIHHLILPEGLKKLSSKFYDVIFIDAPFRKNLLLPCCEWLEQQHFLQEGTFIYLEMEKESMPLRLSERWELWRHKVAGQVAYCLYRFGSNF